MSSSRAWLVALFVALSTSAVVSPAFAQGQPSDASKRALTLGYEADALYAKSRWDEAYERFAEADALAHSPVFVLYMARCRKNAGRLLEARKIYERVAGDQLPASAPKPFREAIADAATELQELGARIPSLVVAVSGAPASEVSLRIGDRAVTAGTPIQLDPGSYEVTATSKSRSARKSVVLTAGAEPMRVELSLAAGASPPPAEEVGSIAPAIVALSFGVVGVGVGSVTGALAASKTSDIESGCTPDGHCPKSSAGDIDSANALATTSTVAFVAGGVGLAAALVLFLVRPGGGSSAKTTALAPSRGRLVVLGTF